MKIKCQHTAYSQQLFLYLYFGPMDLQKHQIKNQSGDFENRGIFAQNQIVTIII